MKDDIKTTVASNLIALRKSKNMTQADVANALNYSDKSVSKWEHADSLPDISILSALCDMYGVTLDYLTHGNAEELLLKTKEDTKPENDRKIAIAILSVSIIFLCSTIAFVYCYAFRNEPFIFWQAFLWGVPASALVLNNLNRKWLRSKRISTVLKSIFLWSFLACVFVQFFDYTLWLIFIVGIPIEIIIVISSSLINYK